MPGPSPYNALLELFGHRRSIQSEDLQRHVKIIKKSTREPSKMHNEKESKKPLKIDNSCQTNPLRDYSYNIVVDRSNRKANKKLRKNDVIYTNNNKVYKNGTSNIGNKLKNCHVCALYKTVSSMKRIFKEERNLHLHSSKCLCSSCGALSVITESMKHPVDFSDYSTDSDDDELDDDDDDDEVSYNVPPRYNSSERHWKIEYKDSDNIKYSIPGNEGYVRLIMELKRMEKRVRSLEQLAVGKNIPKSRNKVDLAYDMKKHHSNGISKKHIRSSTSSSEIDKKQCGLFSIPNLIKRKFSKKEHLGRKQVTENNMLKAPTNSNSKNYKYKNKDSPIHYEKKKTHIDEKYKDLNTSKRRNQKTIIPLDIEQIDKGFSYQKPETLKPKLNHKHNPDQTPFQMRSSPVGLRTIIDKANHRSLRNDATFIRRSNNYIDNEIESNRNMMNIFDDFLKINNIISEPQYNDTNIQPQCQNVLHSVSEESINWYNVRKTSKTQDDTVNKLKLDITKHKQNSAQEKLKSSVDTLIYKSSKFNNYNKNDWAKEFINNSTGVINEKLEISESSIKGKIGKTVTYSKQNEYRYFGDSLLDIKCNSTTYYEPIEIGESSGICKQMNQVDENESSDSDMSSESFFLLNNIPNRKISKNILPLMKSSSQLRIESKQMLSDISEELKSTLINEDRNKTHLFRNEKEAQEENEICKADECISEADECVSEADECISEIFDVIIFKKLPIKEKISENLLFEENEQNIENKNIVRKDNGEKKFVQKKEHRQLIENESFNTKNNEDTRKLKNNEKRKFIVESINSQRKNNEEIKATQTFGNLFIDENIQNSENNITLRKSNIKIKSIQEEEYMKIIEHENFNQKGSEDTKKIEKNQKRNFFEESKSFQRNDNKEIRARKTFDNLVKVENIQSSENKIPLRKDNKEIKTREEEKHLKVIANKNFNRNDSEDTKTIEKNKRTKLVVESKNSPRKDIKEIKTKDIHDNLLIEENIQNSENRNTLRKGKKEIKSIHNSEHKKVINLNKKDNEDTRTIQKIEKNKFVEESKTSCCKKNERTKSSQTFGNPLKEENIKKCENKITFTKDNREIKTIQKNKHDKVVRNEHINEIDRQGTSNKLKIENSKGIVKNRSIPKEYNEGIRASHSQTCEVNKMMVENKSSKRKVSIGIQVTEINDKQENIVEEIHECPLSFILSYPPYKNNDTSQVVKKSILKTYRRASNNSLMKLDKKNSVIINKFKKRVNINIVKKVSSSIIHDIFNKRIVHNVALKKVFKRQKHIKNEQNKIKYSRIPIPITQQLKNITVPNIRNNSSKTLSRIPVYLNKISNKASSSKNKLNPKIFNLKYAKETHDDIFLHYNALITTPTLLIAKKNEINNYNSPIEKVERKIVSDSKDDTRILSVDSNILNSYNSQIEKVERKKVTNPADDSKNSTYPSVESLIITNDISEEKSFYITPPYAIETYESSCTFSECSSGAVFMYKSKCQMCTDMSIIDSEFDTHFSESVYTSTSDLCALKAKRKWKWLKMFGSKFKSFLSINTAKSDIAGSSVENRNSSYNETNGICNGKYSKEEVNERNIKKWTKRPKAKVSFTLTLKKKNSNLSML